MFVLPMLTFTYPDAAADELRWRYSTLAKARARAGQLGLRGAAFPWRTIGGAECSGHWPAGTAAFHVNADIADAVIRYVDVTGDVSFEAGPGLELLVETARLWQSLGHHASSGEFRIDGVTGPDEYSAVADNNVYTNLMAQHNLRAAADAAQRHPAEASVLALSSAEIDAWQRAAGTTSSSSPRGCRCRSDGLLSPSAFAVSRCGPRSRRRLPPTSWKPVRQPLSAITAASSR